MGAASPAYAAIARAIGCSERDSTEAAARTKAVAASASNWGAWVAVTDMSPVVRVPVLSKTTAVSERVSSRTRGPRMRTPICAPRPTPTMIASGVARPRAHGHEMMRTATAAETARAESPVARSHTTKVAIAKAMTMGTKMAEMRSARRCTCALPVCASSTMRAICASIVSAPTRVASTVSAPSVAMVPPTTPVPSRTATGADSPVTREASTAASPSTTMPSVAMVSPGFTTKRMPTSRASRAMTVPSSRVAVADCRADKARMASPAWADERTSSHLPSTMSDTMTAAVSK